jgi:hypothetical protein
MSELAHYYSSVCTGYWKAQNPAECGCGGGGWFLSDVDTWHRCSIHHRGQPHPESGVEVEECECQDYHAADCECLPCLQAREKAAAEEWADWDAVFGGDDIPF